LLFIGAGRRLLAYDLKLPARLWEDAADMGALLADYPLCAASESLMFQGKSLQNDGAGARRTRDSHVHIVPDIRACGSKSSGGDELDTGRIFEEAVVRDQRQAQADGG
jgi:hypothetical protein